MLKRSKRLFFFPKVIRFEDLPEWERDIGVEDSDFFLENKLLQMVFSLNNDKERCILLFLVLREYGFNFDHESCARALHIEWRWYMRIKEAIQKKLAPFLTNAI